MRYAFWDHYTTTACRNQLKVKSFFKNIQRGPRNGDPFDLVFTGTCTNSRMLRTLIAFFRSPRIMSCNIINHLEWLDFSIAKLTMSLTIATSVEIDFYGAFMI